MINVARISGPDGKKISIISTQIYLAVVLMTVLLWRVFFFDAPTQMGYDESIYLQYARILSEHGLAGIQSVVGMWPQDSVLSAGPPPFRPVWLLAAEVGCKLLGGFNLQNLAVVAAFFGIATVVLGSYLALRWLGTFYGALATASMMTSPLAMALSQRGLQDTCFAFVVTACVVFLDRYLDQRRQRDLLLFGVGLFAGFLTKESMIFLYPALIGLFVYRTQPVSLVGNRLLLGILLLAPFAAAVFLAIWAGSFENLFKSYIAYVGMQARIPYSLAYQQGPWFRYIIDLILISPFTTIVSIISVPMLFVEGTKPQKNALIFALLSIVILSLLPLKNVRFILFADIYIRMTAVAGLTCLVKYLVKPRYALAACLAVVLGMVVSDMGQFAKLFETAGIYDPVTAQLVHASEFGF